MADWKFEECPAALVEQEQRVRMVAKLIQVGFDPAETLASFGLPSINHTGVPPFTLQPISQINPEDPSAVY